ncbi:MAG: asparagine synthase (glutamine-hydrolyzing) [Brevundimonas sp.]|jgi:asparagine synthase (glutamine-hydrolysing)
MPGPGDWLAFGPLNPEAGRSRTAALTARLRRLGWRCASGSPAVWLAAQHDLPLRTLNPSGALIGRYHGEPAQRPAEAGLNVWAERMMSGGWGRWVAVLPLRSGVTVLRDPSGALDAFVWRCGGMWVAASGAHPGLDDLLPPDAAVDLDRVAAMLAHAAAVSGEAALSGIHAVHPGGGLVLGAGSAPRAFQAWTPALAAGRHADPSMLRPAVDGAVRELLAPHRLFIGEISGGFDSAVVAASAEAQGLKDRAAAWLNFHGREPEGDERTWARAVARTARLELTERPKTPAPLALADLEHLASGFRPALQGLDVEYDGYVSEQMMRRRAGALLTGQGGDAVFFQYGTPAVAADRVRRMGLRGLDPRFLYRLARWTRRPVWAVGAEALRDRFGLQPPRDPEGAAPPGPGIHPWLAGLENLAPAKRGQIRQLVNAQIFHGDCLRARAGELLHPLLTQPVMEVALGIPVDVLVGGGRDRALARSIFADRLPEEVLSRKGKGELSVYYGQVVLQTLPLARDLLIGGELVQAGLLDRRSLDEALDPRVLIADGAYNLILIRLVLELWLRKWRARLAARTQTFFEPLQDATVHVDDVGRARQDVPFSPIGEQ